MAFPAGDAEAYSEGDAKLQVEMVVDMDSAVDTAGIEDSMAGKVNARVRVVAGSSMVEHSAGIEDSVAGNVEAQVQAAVVRVVAGSSVVEHLVAAAAIESASAPC